MSSRKPPKYISCTRCQSKKIRCNRVQPQCDKCEAIDAECIYVPRKARAKKQSNPTEKDLLLDILRRLERLEDHCKIRSDSEGHGGASRSMSASSDITGARPASIDLLHDSQPLTPNTQPVIHSMLNWIKDDGTRSLLSSNVFCHLRNVESRLFENKTCVKAVENAMEEVERLESTREINVSDPPVITKEMAKRWVKSYYEIYQFEGFRVPLEKSFVMSIPELLEIPHVHLDSTSKIIYYNILLQGIILDAEYLPERGKIIQYLYQSSMMLVNDWLSHIENTLPDMFAAFVMISMTLEGCNSEMSWKIFSYACNIARALGFFSVDEQSDGQNPQFVSHGNSECEVDKNRKRFEFWHLLRMDCLFRLSFGKPALIPGGSWTVNFPDPTITGVDDASTRFIQIHFLASMRLTLTLLKYLDLVDVEMHQDTDVYDQALDSLIAEVQAIMSDWNAEELFNSATNHVDTWFSADILFSSYKMLIVFTQSKRCNQSSQFLPRHTVDVARKSLEMFQSLMSAELHAYWGISLILLHQFIPFFILCADIIGSHRDNELEDDIVLVSWLNDFVDKAAEERPELRPIAAIVKAMSIACQQIQVPAS
ncbi:hypothetical protein BDV40DRAFT_278752 [Aspergillus tamarii]|uniref:Zn(2)-C6 fungal-type domain-containing protein n=1 Tax=Aspergillus tamarii TaxID=41984 RepID=A0A5N6UFG6_ASPTM|nr:hypothetical protein BDV40DRAFT_278752 [Aspergillus tamarii]